MPSHNQGYNVTIDGVSSSTIPEFICHQVGREMVGERRHVVQPIAGLEGGWLFPEQPGMRRITLDCSVLADSFPAERRTAVREVAAWADKTEWVKLVLGDDPSYFNLVILDEVPDVEEWRQLGEFDLVFLAQPYALSTAIQSHQEVSGVDNKTFQISVGGDARTYPIIEVIPNANATKGTFTVAGRSVIYNDAITTTLTLNGIAKVVHTGANVDTDVVGDFTGATISMGAITTAKFPWLDPGTRNITVNFPGSGGWTANVKWRNRTR